MRGGNTPGWVPEYHNLDLIARLIDPSNDTEILVEGQKFKAFLDMGAIMSCIAKW